MKHEGRGRPSKKTLQRAIGYDCEFAPQVIPNFFVGKKCPAERKGKETPRQKRSLRPFSPSALPLDLVGLITLLLRRRLPSRPSRSLSLIWRHFDLYEVLPGDCTALCLSEILSSLLLSGPPPKKKNPSFAATQSGGCRLASLFPLYEETGN